MHDLLIFVSHDFVGSSKDFWKMRSDGSSADFTTVEHDIILLGKDLSDFFLFKELIKILDLRHGKRVVSEFPFSCECLFKHREVYYPTKC